MTTHSVNYTKKSDLTDFIYWASAKEPADLCIQNASIVNVFNREIYKDKDLLIANGRILGIVDANSAKAKKYYDAKQAFILPGFIDAHVHIESSMLAPEHFAGLVLQNGTTAIVADPHEIANVLGINGIKYMIKSVEHIPMHAYFMLPSCVPATFFENSGAVLDARALEELIHEKAILGLGEMMNYPGVLFADSDVLSKIMLAHDHNKVIDGHCPTLHGRELDAYIGSGVKTDHECTTVEEMNERIARGMYVLIRQGSNTKDAETLLAGVNANNAHRCCFCCDDISPKEIIEEGYMQRHLRLAVKQGLDPVLAIQMLTLNPATCYGLQNIGALAPGYYADLVFVDNLQDFNVLEVYAQGNKVAEKGQLLIDVLHEDGINTLENMMNIAPFTVEDLALKVSGPCRVIGLKSFSVVTSSLVMDIEADEYGYFDYAKNKDICKVAVFERHKATGNIGLGLLHGYIEEGKRFNGAIASTVSHDSHNVIVIGDNDNDMYLAVKTLEEHGGGIVLIKEGKVAEILPLPIAGLMSYEKPKKVCEMEARLDDFPHAKNIDPLILLSFLALSVIPELKMTDQGLFNVNSFTFTTVQVD